MRGGPQHFVHSKVMAWVAFDRAADALEAEVYQDSVQRWRDIADEIHADVCERGFDAELNSFVQSYGSKRVDASLLLISLVGFLPPNDPGIQGTIRAVEDKLVIDGEFVLRYETESPRDGLPEGECVSGVQLLARGQLHFAGPICGSAKAVRSLAVSLQ